MNTTMTAMKYTMLPTAEHDHAAVLLIGERGQAPEARRLDVEVVQRRRREREHDAEHRRGHARNGERGDLRQRSSP